LNSFPTHLVKSAFSALEAELAAHRKRQARLRRKSAYDFNVFDFIKPTENVLSDILKFLLDPHGSHGQEDMFLGEMIVRIRPQDNISCRNATVVREALTYTLDQARRRRIDVLATLADFHLAIETKKFSGEGRQQIHDYCEHLHNISHGRFCLIFLNLTGAEAESIAPELSRGFQKQKQLVVWSWEKSIPGWLRACKSNCEAAKINHFLDDFGRYVSNYLSIQAESDHEYDQ
jgi:hypothetical protein